MRAMTQERLWFPQVLSCKTYLIYQLNNKKLYGSRKWLRRVFLMMTRKVYTALAASFNHALSSSLSQGESFLLTIA